jgi:hypothetical protein
VAALGGVPGWADAALIATALVITGAVARKAWHREKAERIAVRDAASTDVVPAS